MKKSLALMLLSSATVFAGELPELFEKPWTAWYTGYESKKFQFGVDPDGEASLIPLEKRSGDRAPQPTWFKIHPVVQEVSPDGKVVKKQAIANGWEAVTPESAEATKIHYRGTVTGEAKFEVSMEIDGDTIYCSGRIIDKGGLTENPIRFAVYVTVPNVYRNTKDEDSLEEKLKEDRFEFILADKKKKKFKGGDTLDGISKEVKVIQSMEADMDYFDGPKFELDAGDIGTLEFVNPGSDPVGEGFNLVWVPDPAKNEGGQGKLMIRFK